MPRTSAISNMSLDDIQRLIQDRQKQIRKLEKQRAKFQKKVDQIDRQIVSLGGSAGRRGRGGGRARNEVSLVEAIAQVLGQGSGPMGVGDITEKVQASGYRSNAANFRGLVNQTLIKDKRFVSAGRGLYQMKGGSGGSEKKGEGKAPRKKARRGRGRTKKATEGKKEQPAEAKEAGEQ